MCDKILLSLKINFNEILVKFTYIVGMIADQNFYNMFYIFLSYGFGYGLRPKAEVCHSRTFGNGLRWKLRLRSNTLGYIRLKVCWMLVTWLKVAMEAMEQQIVL